MFAYLAEICLINAGSQTDGPRYVTVREVLKGRSSTQGHVLQQNGIQCFRVLLSRGFFQIFLIVILILLVFYF